MLSNGERSITGEHTITLEGRWVRLRPPRQEDLDTLYEWRNDPTTLHLWSRRRRLVSPQEFAEELRSEQDYECLKLIVENNTKGPVGLVIATNLSIQDRHAYIGTYIRPDLRNRGYGVEATALFLRYLFAYFGLIKVYATVYEYNHLSRRTLESAGFQLEGTFPLDREWNGRWWTVYHYAFYHQELPRLDAFLDRLAQGQMQKQASLTYRRRAESAV